MTVAVKQSVMHTGYCNWATSLTIQ